MFHESVSAQFYGARTAGTESRWATRTLTVGPDLVGDVELALGGLVADTMSLSAYVNGVLALTGADCTLSERNGQSYVVFPQGSVSEGDVLVTKAQLR